MASGGHRIMVQGEHYHNQDVHLTVAYLRARRSQPSLKSVCFDQIQPQKRELKIEDRKTHGIPRKSESATYSKNYNNAHEDKRELKRRLQQIWYGNDLFDI